MKRNQSKRQPIRLLTLEPSRRNQVLVRLLYIAGLRVSEIVGLAWRDL